MARYRLTERAYIGDRLLEPGTEIGEGTSVLFSGRPGPHMEPLDKAAEKALAALPPGTTLDPFQSMPLSGEGVDGNMGVAPR